jgi:hypothetical protein
MKPHPLPLQQRLAHPARCAKPAEHEDQSDQLRLRIAAPTDPQSLLKVCAGAGASTSAVCQRGVMDYILHPVEPLAIRLSLTGTF